MVVVAFEPICVLTMCFFEKFNFLGLLWMFKKKKKLRFFYRILSTREIIFTAYSLHVEKFLPHTQYTWNIFCRPLSWREIIWKIWQPVLPHTQYTWNNFYRILSTREIIFTAYSVGVGKFLPHTQYTWNNFYRTLSTREIITHYK